jgi:hypothetical protein
MKFQKHSNNIFALLFLILIGFTKVGMTQTTKKPANTQRDADGIDGRMKGPNGQVVYIGEKGGRYYYANSGQKVYVPHNKKTKTNKKVRAAVKALLQ